MRRVHKSEAGRAPWKSWTLVTAPFLECRCLMGREQPFSQLHFIITSPLLLPSQLLVTGHNKGSRELGLPVALYRGVPLPGVVRYEGEADPGARRRHSEDVTFHFSVPEPCLSGHELLHNKVLPLAVALPPWSQTPGLVTALCRVMTPCPPAGHRTHQALRWLHAPTSSLPLPRPLG